MINTEEAVYEVNQVTKLSQDAEWFEGKTERGLMVRLVKARSNDGAIDQEHIGGFRLGYSPSIASDPQTKAVTSIVWTLLGDVLPAPTDEEAMKLPEFTTLGHAADNQFNSGNSSPFEERFENILFSITDFDNERIMTISIEKCGS